MAVARKRDAARDTEGGRVMFADKFKKANDSLKADEKLLEEIKARSDSN